jgi:hypothetical protein
MTAQSPLTTLLAIDADRRSRVQVPARSWLAPTLTAVAALMIGGFAESEFRAGGGPRILSLVLLLFDAAVAAVVTVRMHAGPSDILRSTAVMPVPARGQALFLFRTLVQTPSIIALLAAGSGFPLLLASGSFVGAVLALAVMASNALCVLTLLTASFLWVIRQRKPPALIGATAFLAILIAVAAGILLSLPDPLMFVLPVTWTAAGVRAAATGQVGTAVVCVLLLLLPVPPLAYFAARDRGGR